MFEWVKASGHYSATPPKNYQNLNQNQDDFSVMKSEDNTHIVKNTQQDAGQSIHHLPIGSTVGDYEIIAFLGGGGMGTVYKVRNWRYRQHKNLETSFYALKINNVTSPDFQKEATIPALLTECPDYIIKPISVNHDSKLNVDYIVMKYIDGISLSDCFNQRILTEQECLVVAFSICMALQYLKMHNILHCDIKPSNIMLDKKGFVRLTDFGISMVSQKQTERAPNKDESQRKPKCGTLMYASPEQLRQDSNIDYRTDIFSLGVTLYDITTGTNVFAGKTDKDILINRERWFFKIASPYRCFFYKSASPHHKNKHISSNFSNLIMSMMNYDPDSRPSDYNVLINKLYEMGCPQNLEERKQIIVSLVHRLSDKDNHNSNKNEEWKSFFSGYWTLPPSLYNVPKGIWEFIGLLVLVFLVFWIFNNLPL